MAITQSLQFVCHLLLCSLILSQTKLHSGVQENDAALDGEVISAAISDLANQADVWLLPQNERLSEVVVATQSNGQLDEALLSGELKYNGWSVPDEMRANLRTRNRRAVNVGYLQLKKGMLLVDVGREGERVASFRERYPDSKGFVTVYLPGYSRTHDEALVRVSFGPSPKETRATFLLKRQAGKWIVLKRFITYYL